MKYKSFGIFGKVFFYTLFIVLLAVGVTVIFFANQVDSVAEKAQQEQIANIFIPLSRGLKGKTDKEAAKVAEAFHAKNTSFDFSLSSKDGQIIYQTENFKMEQVGKKFNPRGIISQNQGDSLKKEIYKFTLSRKSSEGLQLIMITDNGGKLYITGQPSGREIYAEYIEKTAFVLFFILLASILGAALFARRIAAPIRKIADDTKRMAELEPVPAPKERKDEIGSLAADVYTMYEALKSTIAELEREIAREKEMEENQRYFFSAASHELKTPIAAMSALLEEMLEGMVEWEDYPESLRKCMRMIAMQKKLVSEILEIVRLSGDKVLVNRQEVRLRDISESLLPMVQPLAEAKGAELLVQVPDDYLCWTDEKLLERVLSNIYTNAVQNTTEGGKVHIWAENKGNDILFCVSNTGKRIEEETMTKLFEPFFRMDQARSRGSGHSGLGLTIVKRTLDRLEIPFSLENTDIGILFWMRLPKK